MATCLFLISNYSSRQHGKRRRECYPGSYIEEELEPAEFGRIAAQAAKRVIVQELEAERAVVEAYKDRVGELVMGVVSALKGETFCGPRSSAEAVILKGT